MRDDSGYAVTIGDLAFLHVSDDDYECWRRGERPLGLSGITYSAIKAGLYAAIEDDGISLDEVDIRIKGSSTGFFSGRHKEMPRNRDEVVALFRVNRRRFPEVFELDEIENRLSTQWPVGSRPLRRPFDSLYRLNLDRVPSDYDIQISSDAIVARSADVARDRGISVTREVTTSGAYNFVLKDLLAAAMPRMMAAASLLSDAVGRDIAIAVFPSAGPPDLSHAIGELSAHHRESDWILRQEGQDPR